MSDVISPSSSSTTSTTNTNNNINSPVNLKGSRPLAMSTTQIGISSSEGHSETPTSSGGTKHENNNNNINSSNPLSLSNGVNNSSNDNNSRPQPLTSFLSMASQQSNHNHEHHQHHFRVASSSAEHDFPSALNHRHQLHQQDSLFVSNSTVIFDEGSASRQESHNHNHQLHGEQEQEKTKINHQSSIPKPLMALAMSPRLLDVNSLRHDDDADHEIVVADGSDRTRNSSDKSSPQKSEESPTKAGGGNTTTTRTTNNSTSSTSKANTSTPSKYYHHSQDNNNATQNSHEQQHQQQSQAQQQPRQENPRRGSLTTLGCVNNSNTSNRPFLNVEPPSNATSVRTSLSLNTAMLSRSRGHLRTHSGATDDDDGDDDDEHYDNDDDGNENHQHQQYYYANVHGHDDDDDDNHNLNYHDYDDNNDESPEGERSGFEHHQHHQMMLNARRMTKQGDDYENVNNNNIYQDGAQRDDEYNGNNNNNNENFFDAPTPSVCRSKQKKSKAERIREMMALDLSLNPEDEFVQDKEVEEAKIMSSNNENDSVLDNNSNQESQRQFPQYSPSPPRSASNRGIECGSGSAVQQQPQQQNGDVSSLLRLKSMTPMSELENTFNNNNNYNSNFNNTTNTTTTTTTSESAPQSTSWVIAHQKKLNMMLQDQQQQQPQSLQKNCSKSPETNNNNVIMSGPPPLAPKRKQRSNTKPPNHAEFKGWEIVSKSMVEQVDEIMMARQMSRNSRGSNGNNNNNNHNYYFSSNDDDEFQGRSRTSSLGCNINNNFNVNDSKLIRNFSNGKNNHNNNNNNNNFESDLDSKQDLSGKLPEQHQQDELLLLQDDNLGNSGFHQASHKQQQQHNQRHTTVLLKLDCDDDNQGGYDEDDVLQRSTTSAPNMKRNRTNSLGRPGSSLSVTPPNDSPPAVDLQDCQGENTNSGSSYRSSLNNNNNAIIAKKTAASSSASSSSKEEIRIMSYNILAQRYVTTDKYREYCSTTSLEQGYRVKNVVRQVAGAKPHILLMQEVATSLAEEGSQLRELLKEQGLDEMIHVTTTLPDGRDRVAAELERQKEMHQESLQTKPQCVGEDDDGTPTKSSATKGNVGLIEGVSISWDPKRFSLVDKDVVKFNVLVNLMACFSPDEKHVLKKASHNVANLVALKDLGSSSCNRKNDSNNNGDDDEKEEDRILNCSTRTDKKNQSSTEENSNNNQNNNTQIFEPLDADDDNNKKKNENASEEPINIIIVACVHIYYDHSRRECQLWHLIKLTEAIEEFKSKLLRKHKNAKVHVILGGDFNCDWNKYPIHFLESGKAVLPASAFGDDHTLMHHYMSKGGNIFGLNYENEKTGGSSDVEKACSSPLVNTLPTGGMFQSASLGGGTTMYSSEAVSTGATPTPPSTFITSAKSSSNNHPISLFPENNNNFNTYGSNNYLDNYFPNNATMISVPPTPAKRGSGPGGRRLSNMSGKNGNGTIQAPNVLLESCQASHSLNLVSAYKDYCVKNPTHVSAHDVQTSFAGVIDLIFFQPSGFRMTKIGRIMSRTYAVPNDRDPSDHCPVAVTLEPLY